MTAAILHVPSNDQFGENAWIIRCDKTKNFAIVDPGAGSVRAVEALMDDGYTCERILLTHAHLDHVWDLAPVKAKTGAPIHMHAEEVPVLAAFETALGRFNMAYEGDLPPDPEPENFFAEGDVIRVGELPLQIIHVPGHAPGHVYFYAGPSVVEPPADTGDPAAAITVRAPREGDAEDASRVTDAFAEGICVEGDIIICGAIGRTDLPGADEATLFRSIRTRIAPLPPATTLLPGHCEPVTVAETLSTNMYVKHALANR